jgi:heat shock protein HslJ
MAGPLPFLVKLIGPVVAMGVLAACQRALSEAKQRPLNTLVGTEWGFAEDDRFVAFKTNGEVNGSGGCNNFFGSFTQEGRRLTFGPLASTKKACIGPTMQAERDFFDLLSEVRAAEANHLSLTLYGETGEVLAVLQRKDWD